MLLSADIVVKCSTRKTPQRSAVFHPGGPQTFAATPDQLSALRRACLVRDHHRCVISHSFDSSEAQVRMAEAGETNALDDDGHLIYQDSNRPQRLEVAQIIPRSLMKGGANFELSDSKKATLAILNMFDTGVVRLLESSDIDRPRNALTLAQHFHGYFGAFKIFFQLASNSWPPTYRIDSFVSRYILPQFPLTQTLYFSEDGTIGPPSSRLLALHCAIAHIIHFSAAGEYIEQLLRDMERQGVCAEDGSTELGRLVRLALRGWSIST
ncbi:hypothetical protein GGR54DRAFT_615960 [Hypoxylon sp. NC1633]|nr:hypothetical protein GGR54DRAFT_615960 [Hypoxylon sp. NC1633]